MKSTRSIGFTLIELLVVIVIIAILAGLLLPAILSAMCSSKTTAANSVIAELGKALDTYYQDYGAYPSTDIYYNGSNVSYPDFCPCPVHSNQPILVKYPSYLGTFSKNLVAALSINGPRSLPYYSFKATDLDGGGNLRSGTIPTDIFSYKECADVPAANKTQTHNQYKYDIYAGDCQGTQANKVKNW